MAIFFLPYFFICKFVASKVRLKMQEPQLLVLNLGKSDEHVDSFINANKRVEIAKLRLYT